MEPPIISNSERTALHRCHRKWWWAYVEGLRSKRKPADALWFGTGIHEALALWYGEGFARGTKPTRTWREWVGDEVREIKANLTDRDREWFDEPVYLDAGELGEAMLEAYLREYGKDPDINVLAIEQPFEIDIIKDEEIIGVFSGVFDGVMFSEQDGLIYLLEHKTAGSITTEHLWMDNQAGSYFAVANIVLQDQGILEPDEYIEGIMYNFLRKAKPDPREIDAQGRALNKDGSVSKRQPARPFHREYIDRGPREVRSQLSRIADDLVIIEKLKTGEIPVTKSIEFTCSWCPYFEMCKLHERGGAAWKEFRDVHFRVQERHTLTLRKSAAE